MPPNRPPLPPAPHPTAPTKSTTSGMVGMAGLSSTAALADADRISPEQASRFLGQAAFGGSAADVAALQALGLRAWLAAQFAEPPSQTHADWLQANGYAVRQNLNRFDGLDNTLWRKLMSGTDVLRQRITLALSEIFVVGMDGLPVPWRAMLAAHYMDTLEAHAFGHYRTLLEAVTLSPAMGVYLSMRGNEKANAQGREPDENFAREVMQLFSIGLHRLHPDGSVQTRDGQPLETYTPDDVRGLARVCTGWDYDRFSREVPDHATRPMAFNARRHSPESKSFLGVQLPEGTDGVAELKVALDTLANHPNVGPFIGRQLIQRLVTSNPSPAYVMRVAAAFRDNGQGVRGDMQALIAAVLLDAEARTLPQHPGAGKLREPMVRMVQWARTFGADTPIGLWSVGNTSNPSNRLGQSPLRAPSVFNYFRPGYVPPGTPLAKTGGVAPEMQITNETTVVGYANWMQGVVANGVGDVKADYSPWLPLAHRPEALFDALNTLLAAGQLGDRSRATVTAAVAAMPVGNERQRLARVQATVWLVLCAPEYMVQK